VPQRPDANGGPNTDSSNFAMSIECPTYCQIAHPFHHRRPRAGDGHRPGDRRLHASGGHPQWSIAVYQRRSVDEATLASRAGVSGASELTVFGVLRDGLEKDGATAELSADARPEQPEKPGLVFGQVAVNYVAGMVGDIPFWMTFDPTASSP
jgi:hypothetical protein